MTRVLIVDDNPLDLRVAAKLVESEGMETAFARNGREAIDQLSNDRPDLLLTDLDMPQVNGLELVREVRRSHPSLPVVLMTARGSEEVAVEALRSGAASYVPKRNLKRDLAETLRMVLAAASLPPQRSSSASSAACSRPARAWANVSGKAGGRGRAFRRSKSLRCCGTTARPSGPSASSATRTCSAATWSNRRCTSSSSRCAAALSRSSLRPSTICAGA